MAYNTKPIVTDKDGKPVSQYFNPSTDQYEPVMGAGGGNRVIVYKSDGTESDVSLLPILEKLSQLTGTVIDEETRKSNELQRIEFYNQLRAMLVNGELKGDTGSNLEFTWSDTRLGVRVQGTNTYTYVDLKGAKGDIGETGSRGLQGIQGSQGLTGSRGLQGIQGIQGIVGLRGETGLKGEQGIQGETGLRGIQGIIGVTGAKGDKGEKGDIGLKGESGVSVDVSGHYYFSVVNGDLFIHYPDGGAVPDFKIDISGNLIYSM